MSYFSPKQSRPTYKPSYTGKSGQVTNITRSIDSIPWDIAEQVYKDAASLAAETAIASYTVSYNEYIEGLENAYAAQNESPYEGNFSDSHPMGQVPSLVATKRNAGNSAIVTEFVERYSLQDFSFWVMPQVTTLLAGLKLTRNDSGKISGLAFGRDHFNTPKMRGLYRFLMLDARSSYLKQQYKADARSSCALVPLVMYAHKLVHNVQYSEWDPAEIHAVVNADLCEAMLYVPPAMTAEEILAERDEGLKIRTGIKAGSVRNPTYTHKLTGPQVKLGIFRNTPALAQVMISQIWCAHPENRTKYMILDPTSWDRVPPPLVSTNVFKAAIAQPKVEYVADVPWM
jgi:hypothetical protein